MFEAIVIELQSSQSIIAHECLAQNQKHKSISNKLKVFALEKNKRNEQVCEESIALPTNELMNTREKKKQK